MGVDGSFDSFDGRDERDVIFLFHSLSCSLTLFTFLLHVLPFSFAHPLFFSDTINFFSKPEENIN